MTASGTHISEELDRRREALAEAIVQRYIDEHPEQTHYSAKQNRAKCVQDAQYHITYLSQATAVQSAVLFHDYIDWAKTLFEGLSIPIEHMRSTLHIMVQVIESQCSRATAQLCTQYITQAIALLCDESTEADSFLRSDLPLQALAQQYLAVVLAGNRALANELVMDAVKDGTAVADIYMQVFQPCQREVGRLWQANQISVGQEHFCTAITQWVMSQLYPYILNKNRSGKQLVATCVGGELHELGVRMVADFFEMGGWDTYYLGANVPSSSVRKALQDHQAHVLGISATITMHIQQVRELIEEIRNDEQCASVIIIVGGYPFNIEPNLWKSVGADGYALDAPHSVRLAEQLTGMG